MKKIGIYLSITPNFGGTYQYSLSIIDALATLDSNKYSVHAFFNDERWVSKIPISFQKHYIKRHAVRYLLGKMYKEIDISDHGMIRFATFFNPLLSEINRCACDLLIFPNQDEESCQCKCPSLVSIHDIMHRYEPHFPEYSGGVYRKRERLYKNICKKANGILVDSELGKTQIIESYSAPLNKIYVLPYLPPSYIYTSREVDVFKKYSIPEKYLFYPAQFWEHKNHESLIKAVNILKNDGIYVCLVLCGAKKNAYHKVIDLISKLNLNNDIMILGYVPEEDIYSLYKHAIATVFVSSLGPTNIPPLEAMWVGSPLIVSNTYAMPEQVGDAALLVNPVNPYDIAIKVKEILSSEELRNRLIINGKKRISLWTQKEFSKRLEKIIHELSNDEK